MNILVVDGYNVIGDWPELQRLKYQDFELARHKLMNTLSEYQAFSGDRVIVVFDALYVKGTESKQKIGKLEVIYTKEDETADECIERLVSALKNVKNQVYVATSDYMEQKTIFSRGALRISARELRLEIESMGHEITRQIIETQTQKPKRGLIEDERILQQLEALRRKKE